MPFADPDYYNNHYWDEEIISKGFMKYVDDNVIPSIDGIKASYTLFTDEEGVDHVSLKIDSGWRILWKSENLAISNTYWNEFEAYIGWGVMQPLDMLETIAIVDRGELPSPVVEVSAIKCKRNK